MPFLTPLLPANGFVQRRDEKNHQQPPSEKQYDDSDHLNGPNTYGTGRSSSFRSKKPKVSNIGEDQHNALEAQQHTVHEGNVWRHKLDQHITIPHLGDRDASHHTDFKPGLEVGRGPRVTNA